MRVCVIGWYGTETIGDRAIFAGILMFLSEAFPSASISLGSLYPFFSQRTLSEDSGLWAEMCGETQDVELFDSSRVGDLKKAIEASDLLLLGGGPLMDLREMHMIDFAFQYARRKKIRTGVFGCGLGPLKKNVFKRAAINILKNADFVVFRDRLAQTEATRLCSGKNLQSFSAVDPAAYCATLFRSKHITRVPKDQIVINLREISWEYEAIVPDFDFEDFAAKMIEKIMTENESHKVVLVPHHYFFFGGDDRRFLNTIKYRLEGRGLMVQNRPLSLSETMQTFLESAFCIGMRFHAMLLMTLLNGRCRILNYTGGVAGKIRGYLNDFDPDGFFDDSRMLSLDSASLDLSVFDNLLEDASFEPPRQRLEEAFQVYRSVLSEQL